jgi:hypothetical protein
MAPSDLFWNGFAIAPLRLRRRRLDDSNIVRGFFFLQRQPNADFAAFHRNARKGDAWRRVGNSQETIRSLPDIKLLLCLSDFLSYLLFVTGEGSLEARK